MTTLAIRFDRQSGEIRAIYDDRLLPYIDRLRTELGLPASAVRISRASHVEPDHNRHGGGNWFVSLQDVGGPTVYANESGQPFVTRESALSFERRWLLHNWLNSNE